MVSEVGLVLGSRIMTAGSQNNRILRGARSRIGFQLSFPPFSRLNLRLEEEEDGKRVSARGSRRGDRTHHRAW